MSERWIVGIDGSDCALHAARWATMHAAHRADEIGLVGAWSVPTAPALPPIGPMSKSWDVGFFEAVAQANVSEAIHDLEPNSSVPITQSVARGHSSSVLLDAARDASLLIVGSRGKGGFSRLVMGSTSTQCTNHATKPTVVIPGDAKISDAKRIVVAVDGSANSTDAVRWAAHFAAPGTTVECVSVWDNAPIAIGTDQFCFPESSELAHERFEHHIESLSSDLVARSSDVRLEGRFIEGRVRCALANVAAEHDLLVMGARGRGAISAALLGSVSSWLLHHLHSPMVVVPHEDRADS